MISITVAVEDGISMQSFSTIIDMEEYLKENGYDAKDMQHFMARSATPEVWFENLKNEIEKVADQKREKVTFGRNPFKEQ